jgi:hypothetical protein
MRASVFLKLRRLAIISHLFSGEGKMDSQEKVQLDDIKAMFDGVKNFALCVAIVLGLQSFQSPMEQIGLSYEARATINTFGIALSVFLTAFAVVWLCFSMKERPKSKIYLRICRFMLGTATLVVMLVIIIASSMNIPHLL